MRNWVVNILELTIKVKILDLLERSLVSPVLLYRRLRYGYAFRRLRMTQPRYAKVDLDDYERLRKYEWYAAKSNKGFYARGCVTDSKTAKARTIYMHQKILEVPKGMVVDHINHDKMDDRRANLRAATRAQNVRNRKKFSNSNGSKYKGIYFRKKSRKWEVMITFERKKIHLGCFKDEIDAAKAYDAAAKKYHGEFAVLNFPS